jgi:inner membrane protein
MRLMRRCRASLALCQEAAINMGWLTDILTTWGWLVAALILAGLEIAMPGAFLIWLAGAAAVTGVLTGVLGLGWQVQLPLFAMLAIASILLGRAYLKRHPIKTDDSGLNRRGDRMVGQVVEVVEPIVGGDGKVQVGDSPWLASGPDAAKGTRVRVLAVEGATLRVEPV